MNIATRYWWFFYYYYDRASSDYTSSCIVICSSWTRLNYDNSPPFCALWRCEIALFIGANLWRLTKPAMSTLELVKNGRVDVLLPMSSNHNMFSIFTEFEKKYFKKWWKRETNKNNEKPWTLLLMHEYFSKNEKNMIFKDFFSIFQN